MIDMTLAYVSIGSNINPEENTLAAISLLCEKVEVLRLSSVYRSKAESDSLQPDYLNCVAEIDTSIAPIELKHRILRPIEDELQRTRTADKFAPRTIDLDLILYGDCMVRSDDLTLPDSGICRRSFLAIPLSELVPDMILPGAEVCIRDIVQMHRFQLERLDAFSETLQLELGNRSR